MSTENTEGTELENFLQVLEARQAEVERSLRELEMEYEAYKNGYHLDVMVACVCGVLFTLIFQALTP